MKKAIFFDVDDTLCATGKVHDEAFRATFKNFKLQENSFDYNDIAGLRTEDVFRKFLNSEEDVVRATAMKRLNYQSRANEISAMPGAREILDFLMNKSVTLVAVSSGSRSSVYTVLEAVQLKHYFSLVITCEMTSRSKPFPDPYRLAILNTGFREEDCLVVEDSENGVQSGISAGIETVLVSEKINIWKSNYSLGQFSTLFELKKFIELGS
jgi:beta-phosphoglucomutase